MAWFDLQINGYAGVDFNQDDLKAEDLHRACESLKADNLRGFLATVISDSADKMKQRLHRLASLRAKDSLARETMWGIHVEGPFLSAEKGYYGAHPLDAMRAADPELAAQLLEAGGGLVRLVTIAPEQDPGAKLVKFLVNCGVVVSAGHTNASLEALKQAVDAGLSMFTHLGNGCPMQLPRHDNIVQRVLSLRDHLSICFIADGIHVPFFALRNYFDLVGLDRVIITTDAMSAAGLGPGEYRLGRWNLNVGADLAVRSPDGTHLVGSAVPMPRMIDNLRRGLSLDAAALNRIADANPRRALRLGSATP